MGDCTGDQHVRNPADHVPSSGEDGVRKMSHQADPAAAEHEIEPPCGERVRKCFRRSPHYKGEFPCTITTKGLAIFPLDAPDRAEPEQLERYSSGVSGLDEMTNGGFLRNSISSCSTSTCPTSAARKCAGG